jgi:hypothetical protein
LVDVTGNGILDVVENTTVRLGNGDGTFQAPIKNPIPDDGGNVVGSVAGHFHGAQAPVDLVVLEEDEPDAINGGVFLERGNGDGTFQAPIPLDFGGILPTTVAAGDFTHSGHLDLVVTSEDATAPVRPRLDLLRGNGDGTFQAPVRLPFNIRAVIEAGADLRGNGNLDLVLDHAVLLGNGDGTFQSPLAFSNGSSNMVDVAVGHLRGDQAPLDLVTANGDFPGTVSVLLGNGDGTFQRAVKIPIGQESSPRSVALADFNGDGHLDIVTTNQFDLSQRHRGIDVLFGNGDGTFQAPQFIRTEVFVNHVLAGDLNGDGSPDVVTLGAVTFPTQNFDVLLNQGDGTFSAPVATATALSADVNPAVVGQTVNLTALVTRAAGIPTGTVTFMDGSTVLGTAALDGTGTATLAVAFPTAGDHAVTAVYRGQGSSTSSTSDIRTETVTPAATAVALSPSVATGVAGVPVDFAVTVSPVAPGAGTPTGTVTLFDGDTALGTAQLDGNGQVVFTFALDAGVHHLTVAYGGDANFQVGLSDALDFSMI